MCRKRLMQPEQLHLDFPPLEALLVDLPRSTPLPPRDLERHTFIITKNHSDRLRLTLPLMAAANDHAYVVDSSTDAATRELCASLADGCNIHYHGPVEQRLAIESSPVLQKALAAGFITLFSQDCWDIWSKRNYILLFALGQGLSQVLLADDDIIPPVGLISDVLARARRYVLVGSNIAGMPDMSIVGHVCSLHGIVSQSFVSGHFLAVNVPAAAQYYFPDIYNEDWIFVLMNSLTSPVVRYGTIFQLYWNPFDGTHRRAAFEEQGEVIVEGIVRALLADKDVASLEREEHWQQVLSARRRMHGQLASSQLVQSAPVVSAILGAARDEAMAITAKECLMFWRDYSARLTEWRSLIAAAAPRQMSHRCSSAIVDEEETHPSARRA